MFNNNNNNNIHGDLAFYNNENSVGALIFYDIATLNIDIQDQTSWNNILFPTYLYDQYVV